MTVFLTRVVDDIDSRRILINTFPERHAFGKIYCLLVAFILEIRSIWNI